MFFLQVGDMNTKGQIPIDSSSKDTSRSNVNHYHWNSKGNAVHHGGEVNITVQQFVFWDQHSNVHLYQKPFQADGTMPVGGRR